jgi:hypothetical protein
VEEVVARARINPFTLAWLLDLGEVPRTARSPAILAVIPKEAQRTWIDCQRTPSKWPATLVSERLRHLRPGFAATLRQGRAREAIQAFELDSVRIDDTGNITFGRSNAAKAQLLRLLEDGYLLSEVSATRYSARAKDMWPTRRVVTGLQKDQGVIAALVGDGAWSPRSIADIVADMTANEYRYAVASTSGHVAITHRKRAGTVVLHAFDEDDRGGRIDLLTTLEELP